MKPALSPETPIENVGFSLPTTERLRSENVLTLGDLIATEERRTASVFTKTTPLPRQDALRDSIDTLGLSGNMRNQLLRKDLRTISDILSKPLSEILNWGHYGTRMHLVVKLIDLGYTVADGPFLNQHYFADTMRSGTSFRFVLKMDGRGLLSKKFKTWFNEAIKGRVYNTDKRPTRKFSVAPFKIED